MIHQALEEGEIELSLFLSFSLSFTHTHTLINVNSLICMYSIHENCTLILQFFLELCLFVKSS